jgi:RimJ/RimL family protein N-acetyltransferase
MFQVENYLLKKLTETDFPLHFELVCNASVMEKITGKPLNETEARDKFSKILRSNAIHPDFGYFKITEKDSGNFVGVVKLEITKKDSSEAEIGYMILPEYWGKGIISTVAKKLLDMAKRKSQLNKVYAIIDPENIPSRKILEKNGFQSKEFKDYDGLPGEMLELLFDKTR